MDQTTKVPGDAAFDEKTQWVIFANVCLLNRVSRLAKEGKRSGLDACFAPRTALYTGIMAGILTGRSLGEIASWFKVAPSALLSPIAAEEIPAIYDRMVAARDAAARTKAAIRETFKRLGGGRPMTTRQADLLWRRAGAMHAQAEA
jgi:hypothetical protein